MNFHINTLLVMDEKEKIEKIMQIEDLNSVQFASEIGIQGSTLSHILNGRNKPSLDVLKKILNRFRSINSDWLILDIGAMYRQEKHSQSPTLFDSIEEKSSNTSTYTDIIAKKSDTVLPSNQKSEPTQSQIVTEYPKVQEKQVNVENDKLISIDKTVKKIIVYYSDNTFQELETK